MVVAFGANRNFWKSSGNSCPTKHKDNPMSQIENAKAFAALHKKDNPLVLYNIWNAGGAKAVAEAGAAETGGLTGLRPGVVRARWRG